VDFDLPADVEQLRRTVRKFVDEAVIPVEQAIERDNTVPDAIRREAGRLGLFGITIPEEYGGSGLGALARCIVHQELGRSGLGSICSIVGAHTGIGTIGIVRTGSSFLKEKYLPALASGEAIAAYAITEPNTGSDVAGVQTRAERRGDRFVLNGVKHFITNGDLASVITVIARTGPAGARKRHLSAFLVERGSPGFRVARTQDTMGLRGSHIAELVFEDCEVPETNRLGEDGEGLAGTLGALSEGRIGIAGRCVGAMERLLELSTAYAKERVQFGRPIAEFQAVQHARRRLDGSRYRPAPDLRDGVAARPRPGRPRPGLQGQAVRLRGVGARRGSRGADPRGLRVRGRVRDREVLPRRAHHADLRGHERDPARDHRQGPAPGVTV
jgi:acyl-CoA dehydrogenase